ncbi:MAG: phosphatase PAP2 family protein [Oscillospiraceae bacterium]|nr:phosphatase PAP2 family protein [Oscillospiraceae bacterium]
MINKQYKYGYLAVIVLCVAAMAAGAKYDWMITDTLYNPQNMFGVIFEAASWLPVYAFIPVLGACNMVRSKNNMTTFTVGAFLLIASCCIFSYSVCDHFVARGFMRKVNPYLCGIFGGVVAAALFLVIRGVKRSVIRKMQAVCGFAFVYMLSYLAVIFALKMVFGRDRYEDIITGGEYLFAEWFRPVFFSSGSSFPSGHTAAAMGIVVLLLLPFIFRPFKNLKLPLFVFCYAYAFLTAFSRIIMGRHFVSDTAAAILIMTIIFIILTPKFEKLYKKELLKE